MFICSYPIILRESILNLFKPNEVKQLFAFFTAIACSALSAFGQVSQNFETVTSLNSLTSNCWQFMGASLSNSAAAGARNIAINPVSVGSSAWVITPYINLNTSSSISFAYKISKPLSAGASRTISVRLAGVDGKSTPVGSITLDHQAATTLYTFSGKSPVTAVQKLVIEVQATGDLSTTVHVDNFAIAGSFNYNPPYKCREGGDGATTIHYLKSFQGVLAGENVQLQWTVAENENNNYFEVEKSTDGNDFKSVAVIKASARVAVESYSFSDPAQTKAYYRLKLVSKANIRMYSNVVFFKSGATAAGGLTLLQNPVQQSLKFGFTSENKTAGLLTIYNQSGIKIFQKEFQAWKGYNFITAQLDAQFKSGLYLLEVTNQDKRNTVMFLKD